MTNSTKLYADGIFVSEDKALIQDIKIVLEAKKHLSEEQFNELHKQFCDKVRESLGVENVIGTVLSDDEKEVYVPFFSIKASDNNRYTLGYNFETGRFYMELEQPLPLEVIDLEIKEVKEYVECAIDFDDAKEHVENLNNLHELRKDMVSYLEMLEEVEELAKTMLGAIPVGFGVAVRA
ncbi:hypothetical protein [Bacillus gaemokensis]|uniref:Uncharacterized protein n=1 Tax=Bacillus gaemokensis TaxID=574375 RepID=A0A073KBP8_9BACI|nr:hypothetical protein [Bacillus gaemokensis]KEK23882.1 hypothetical protein BAGA_05420 [Bacillus gaemokensis]KYG38123.1 hypothetical protein AZF08_20455 [Bacillus gaemokensis]